MRMWRSRSGGHPGVEERRESRRFGIVLGGTLTDDMRDEVVTGEHPQFDVLELERLLDCRSYDYAWLDGCCERERVTRTIRRATSASMALSLRASRELRHADSVYTTGEDVGFALAVALFFRRRVRVLVRLEQLDIGRTPTRRAMWRAYRFLALKRVDVLFCRTTDHIAQLRTLGHDRAILAPEPKDPLFWSKAAARSTTDVARDRPRLLSGGLEERDYPTLIEAVRGLPIDVTIAASSPWSKFGFVADVDDVSNIAVSAFSPSEMRRQFAMADVVVVPVHPTTRSCGISVVLEAWAMQVPVIASATSGLDTYLSSDQNAVTVRPEDRVALRTAIERLLADADLRQRLVSQGRSEVEGRYALDRYVSLVSSEMGATTS